MDLEQYKNEVKIIEKNIEKKKRPIGVIFFLFSLGVFLLVIFILNDNVNGFWFVVLFFLFFYGFLMSWSGAFSWILKRSKEYRDLQKKLESHKDEIKKIEEQIAQKRREEKREERLERLNILKDIYREIFNKKVSYENIDLCQKFVHIIGGEWNSEHKLWIYNFDSDFSLEDREKVRYFRQYSSSLWDRINNFFEKDQNRRIENGVQTNDNKERSSDMFQGGNVRLVESDTLAPPPVRFIETKDIDKLPIKRIKIDFLEKNKKNTELGLRGELIVLDWEKSTLIKEGLENLAGKVRHISQEFGDGFGFDILSFNKDGSDKFIEVKTTKKGIDSQFYFSENELNFIKDNQDYYLYRLNLQDENEAELTIINREDFINKFEIFPYQYIVKLKE